MILDLRRSLAQALAETSGLAVEHILRLLEKPKNSSHGDLAFPAFEYAKHKKLPPQQAASQLAAEISLPQGVREVVAIGPFLNFRLDRVALFRAVVNGTLDEAQVRASIDRYLTLPRCPERPILLEYSSPNIAKPFHVGHLRATLVGNSLDHIYRYLGYPVVSINHLGDWGTQFGFVWAGCSLWGKPADDSVKTLLEIYKKATALKEAQERDTVALGDAHLPDVNALAREYFLKLEAGEEEAVSFWKWCLEISLKYFRESYDRLGVHFDHYTGESFYFDKLAEVRTLLDRAGILRESDGAWGVDLGAELGFARIYTPDGRSLYLTRDLAAARYRAETFHFLKAFYIVGAPQTLHFQQIKGILRAVGESYADDIVHLPFGHVLGIKTRGEGGFIELNDFLDEAHARALDAYRTQVAKRPEGLDENEVAEQVGLAAVAFANLNRQRIKDVVFNWQQALQFQGDSGPYVLYAYARINGIKEKAAEAGITLQEDCAWEGIADDTAHALVMLLADFPAVVARTVEDNEPAYLANYALDVSQALSTAYLQHRVVGEATELASARLALFEATRQTLHRTLTLLGLPILERM